MRAFLYARILAFLVAIVSGAVSMNAETLPVRLDIPEKSFVAGVNRQTTKKILFSNLSGSGRELHLRLNTAGSSIPAGWQVGLEREDIFLAAHSEEEVQLRVSTNEKAGYARISLIADYGTDRDTVEMRVLSQNARYILLNLIKFNGTQMSPAMEKYEEALKSIPAFRDSYAVMDYDKNALGTMMSTIEAVIFPISGGHVINGNYNPNDAGNPLAVTDASLNYPNLAWEMQRLITMEKKVLVFAPTALWWTFAPSSGQIGKHQDAINFFTNTLGIDLENQIFRAQSSNWPMNKFDVKGYAGDSAGRDFAGTANINYQLATLYTDIIKFRSSKSVKTFYADDIEDHVVGVRRQIEDARIIFNSFALEAFSSPLACTEIMDACMKWLTGAKDPVVKIPVIAVDEQVDAGKVALRSTEVMVIPVRNEGDTTLIISNVEFADTSSIFTLGDLELPLSVSPGETKIVSVYFTPAEKKGYEATLMLSSNTNNTEDTWTFITLSGEGADQVSSVEEASGEHALSLSPNPAAGSFTLHYTTDAPAQTARILIVNELGSQVFEGMRTHNEAGRYSEHITPENLAAGRYELLVQSGTKLLRAPLVIIR